MKKRIHHKTQKDNRAYKETQTLIKQKKIQVTMDECNEIEEVQDKDDSFGVHKKVTEISLIYNKQHPTGLKICQC